MKSAVHDLDDRPEALLGRTERRSENRGLRDRGVENALPAELPVQPPRDPENAARYRDVLAEENHLGALGELAAERLVEGGGDRHRRCRARRSRLRVPPPEGTRDVTWPSRSSHRVVAPQVRAPTPSSTSSATALSSSMIDALVRKPVVEQELPQAR